MKTKRRRCKNRPVPASGYDPAKLMAELSAHAPASRPAILADEHITIAMLAQLQARFSSWEPWFVDGAISAGLIAAEIKRRSETTH